MRKVSVAFSIIPMTAAVLLFAGGNINLRSNRCYNAYSLNPPTTIVNPCPLGTIPETTTTGTVCLLILGGCYSKLDQPHFASLVALLDWHLLVYPNDTVKHHPKCIPSLQHVNILLNYQWFEAVPTRHQETCCHHYWNNAHFRISSGFVWYSGYLFNSLFSSSSLVSRGKPQSDF